MTSATTILEELRALGGDGYRRVLLNHGVQQACFGVKIEELKRIQKRLKQDHRLALELYDTGVYDAMYLAGLMVEDGRMTREDLSRWVEQSAGPLSGSIVPWVAAGSPHAREMARRWIDSERDHVATAGWMTWSSWVSVTPDEALDLEELGGLLRRVEATIHQAPNGVRPAMNSFVIALGSCVKPLTGAAREAGQRIGQVEVDVGRTSCRIPFAPDYIRKVEARGALGRKRRTAKC
jgi:hypothetical protein